MRIIKKILFALFFAISISPFFCVALDESYTVQSLIESINTNAIIASPVEGHTIHPDDISNALNFCNAVSILNYIVAITSYTLPFLLPIFGNALGGDMLTGNAFVEGSNEETLVAIKLNKSLQTLHHISLNDLQEIFMHLREDITKRARYLDHRQDKEEILKTLHEREKRLLHNLHSIEKCVFHFREHGELTKIQHKFLITGIILTPFIIAIIILASFDVQKKSWHMPTEEQILVNTDFFLEKKTP